ncbi:MAG: NAD-dependent epimerase/dehydratase family protein [Nocardioidaceae bacterium]
MRVLVTGATGMLGRATTTTLMSRGDEVTVLQRGRSGLDCREVRGDLADATAVRRAVRGQDAVVHLAAKVDVTGPWHEYASANIEGTRNVVAASRSEGVGRLVHVSSPSVAHSGRALMGVGADRADPARARGHYARSKATAELEALAADSGSLAVLAVRPHLVWGPGDTQLVGRIVARARAGRLPILGPGAALIDTTYVDNASAALVAALDVCGPENGQAHGEALVVSNGEPRPVLEILEKLCRAAGVPGPRRRVPFPVAWLAGLAVEGAWAVSRRRDTPPLTRFLAEQLSTAHWFDQRRTRAVLGWHPGVTLECGFARLAAWYRQDPSARGHGVDDENG